MEFLLITQVAQEFLVAICRSQTDVEAPVDGRHYSRPLRRVRNSGTCMKTGRAKGPVLRLYPPAL